MFLAILYWECFFPRKDILPKKFFLLDIGISDVLITLFTVYKNDMVDSKLELNGDASGKLFRNCLTN